MDTIREQATLQGANVHGLSVRSLRSFSLIAIAVEIYLMTLPGFYSAHGCCLSGPRAGEKIEALIIMHWRLLAPLDGNVKLKALRTFLS